MELSLQMMVKNGEYTNNGTIVTDDGEERDLLADLQTFNNCYIKITVKQVEEDE